MKETTGVITNHLSQYLQNITYIFARVLGLCKFYLKVLHPVFTLLANATRTFASVVKTFLFLLFVADGSKVCFEPSLSNICLLHVVKDKFVAHLPWLGCELLLFFFNFQKSWKFFPRHAHWKSLIVWLGLFMTARQQGFIQQQKQQSCHHLLEKIETVSPKSPSWLVYLCLHKQA